MATILHTRELKPGMITAEAIQENEQLILQKNVVLTSNIIHLLSRRGISTLKVKENIPHLYGVGQGQRNEVTEAALIVEDIAFFKKYQSAIVRASEFFRFMRQNETLPFTEINDLANNELYELLQSKGVIGSLYKLKPYADYTFLHMIDVGIIAGSIGRWCGLNKEEVQTLILCGVMHDIGKSQIPLSILDKPDKLTPKEKKIVDLHPEYGYYMTKSMNCTPEEVQYAILQHHERENGEGYPKKLTSCEIHPFAKIIAIADTYDALTTDKAYQRSVTPFKALEILVDEMFGFFELEYCKTLIHHVMKNLIGATVLLSNGKQAKVERFDYFMSLKPIVVTERGLVLDLHRISNVSVVEVLRFCN
ncbi:MAG: hypothetical protein H6Q67_52 [Firmicutes bacterium]|nr:hypothetical protein [Bacillota bacterium]